jgi:hypothetical protein
MSSEARHRTSSHDVTIDDRDPTVRTPTIDTEVDALPDQAVLYEAPRRLPAVSEHKTLDMVPVRLAPDVDPRRARTQRLSSPGTVDSGRFWLLAGVLTASVLVVAASLAWMSRRQSNELTPTPPTSSVRIETVANQLESVQIAEEADPGHPERPAGAPTASSRRVKVQKAKPARSSAPTHAPTQDASRKEQVWLE